MFDGVILEANVIHQKICAELQGCAMTSRLAGDYRLAAACCPLGSLFRFDFEGKDAEVFHQGP